ncbi:hypothetical protein [Ekhidna sp.]|uniref:hypothetical protein n=1 Tax=Ekhidna sp. TaxID=2608089 RepID=UPI003BA9A8E6
MKKLRNLVIAMILMVSTINAGLASGVEHSLFVHVVGEKLIDLHLSDISGKVRLYLANEEGDIIHEQNFKAKKEMKIKIDLNKVEVGNYTLTLRDQAKQQSVPLNISNEEVKVDMSLLSKTYFPKVKLEKELMMVQLLSNETNDLHVSIHSSEGELLFDDKIKGAVGLIGKRFKFLPGNYKLTLTSNGFSEVKYYSF